MLLETKNDPVTVNDPETIADPVYGNVVPNVQSQFKFKKLPTSQSININSKC